MVSLGSGHDRRDESAQRGEEDHMTEEMCQTHQGSRHLMIRASTYSGTQATNTPLPWRESGVRGVVHSKTEILSVYNQHY